MISISPTPSLSRTDAFATQQLLSQIQNHQLTMNQTFFTFIAFTNPLPVSWKFAIYHFLNAFPLPPIPLWLMIILYFFGPFILMGTLYWSIKYLPRLIQIFATIISFTAALFSNPSEDLTMLELTFPMTRVSLRMRQNSYINRSIRFLKNKEILKIICLDVKKHSRLKLLQMVIERFDLFVSFQNRIQILSIEHCFLIFLVFK